MSQRRQWFTCHTRSAMFCGLASTLAPVADLWDEADALARLAALSHPRVTIDTAGLSPDATELANRLALRGVAIQEDGQAFTIAGVNSFEERP